MFCLKTFYITFCIIIQKISNEYSYLILVTLVFFTQDYAFLSFRTILNGSLHFKAISPLLTCLGKKQSALVQSKVSTAELQDFLNCTSLISTATT